MARLIKTEVLTAEFGDVHQALDVHRVERDEQTETGGRSHHAAELFSQMLTHVLALEPSFNVTTRFIGAPLIGAAVQASSLPSQGIDRGLFHRLVARWFDAAGQAFAQLGMGLAGGGQGGQLVTLAEQNGFDHTVHQQVGVAPNGAGEVGVSLKRQTKVTVVLGRVNGLLHGAQQHRVDLLSLRAVFGGRRNGLELARVGFVADALHHAHGLEVVAQCLELFGRGAFMNPEQSHVFALPDEVGRTHVGRQHGFFDELVGFVARARHDLFDAPCFITNDLGFGGFKIHRAAHLTRSQQRTVDLVQVQQVWHHAFSVLRLGTTGVGQNRRDLGVRQSRVTEHHRGIELIGVHIALGRDKHVADHAQALNTGVERTQTIGEFLRQHGDHAAGKIHRGGAVVGVHINGRAGLHVVTDIGNGHEQTVAFATTDLGRFAIHRVVKVTGVFAVDGDQWNVTQVHAVVVVAAAHMIGQSACLSHGGIREHVRHAVFAHRDLNFHTRVVDFSEHFFDSTDRLAIQSWRLGELNHHHLTRLGAANGRLRHEHILAITLVFWRNQPDATFLQQAADDGAVRPLHNFGHATLWPTFSVLSNDANLDTVFVQDGPHLIGWKVDVGLSVITHHKAVTVAVTRDGAFNFCHQAAVLIHFIC